jgi:hypothetical protein
MVYDNTNNHDIVQNLRLMEDVMNELYNRNFFNEINYDASSR